MVKVKNQQNAPGVNPAGPKDGAAKPAPKAAPAAKAGLRPVSMDEIRALGGGEQQQPEKVKVRFAPSPTGHLHIGGAWVALRNAMLAERLGGDLVLRIEDTDRARSRQEYTDAIMDGLQWLGVEFKGEPVYQSKRGALYAEKIEQLLESDQAYKDASGAVFFRMPTEGAIVINDRVKGTQKRDAGEDSMSDFVIARADGSPTFLLANVVDDGDQGITHVLRGDDHMDNAFKQVCLFRALGYRVPEFYHMPLIHADTGGKLSKRHGATSVFEYRNLGYDPQVLMNHLARIGCHFDSDETYSFEDLAKRFDPMNISKSPGRLGMSLLDGRMFKHIREMPVAELASSLKARVQDPDALAQLVDDTGTESRPGFAERTGVLPEEGREALTSMNQVQFEALAHAARSRMSNFAEALDTAASFRGPVVHLNEEKARFAGPKQKEVLGALQAVLAELPAGDWTPTKLEKTLDRFVEAKGLEYMSVGESLRWALTSRPSGFPLHLTLGLLGRDLSTSRLASVLEGASK